MAGALSGVMLREMSPSSYRQSRVAFWARRQRHRSILTERVQFERSLVTRLSHVETCFDVTAHTVSERTPESDMQAAANVTGMWMAEGCREQLRSRNRAGTIGFFVPEEWRLQRRRRPYPRGRLRSGPASGEWRGTTGARAS